jgi:hypothetical protein
MKRTIIGIAVLLGIVLIILSLTVQSQAPAQAPVKVGQTYNISIGMAVIPFSIQEIGPGGLVRAIALDSAQAMGIRRGSIWWVNLNQAVLIEAK